LNDCVADLVAHQRRVGTITWHPTAHYVLLSAGSDNKIFVWNVATAEILTEINDHNDMIYTAVWNYTGSRLVTTCKDKMIRVFDPRTGKVLSEGKGHQAVKPMRAVCMRDDRIFTTGFSRMGERQYGLWDPSDLSKPLVMEDLDNSNGLLFPFYDEDTNIIYLCGKGDSAIRYFEYTNEAPYIFYLNTFTTSDPQRGMGYMTKRGLNVTQCEIAKLYKLHNSGLCEVINFTVPRKSELFQDDLYPDTAAEEAALSAEEWFAGRDAEPVKMAWREVFQSMTTTGSKSIGGSSVLRQGSNRFSKSEGINGTNGNENQAPPSTGMSRLSAKPASKEPTPSNTPAATSNNSSSTLSNNTTHTVNIHLFSFIKINLYSIFSLSTHTHTQTQTQLFFC
jgi:coronin-1B/1C/6